MKKLLDRWVPQTTLADPDEARRARVIIGTSMTFGVVALLGVSYRHYNTPYGLPSLIVYGLLIGAWFSVPSLVRRWGNLSGCGHLVSSGSMLMVTLAAWFNGGLRAPIIAALLLVPLFTGLTNGIRASLSYGVVAILIIAGFLALELTGNPRPVPFQTELDLWRQHGINIILILTCILAMVGFYETERSRKELLLRKGKERYRQAISGAQNAAYEWVRGQPFFCTAILLDWLDADDPPHDLAAVIAQSDRERFTTAWQQALEGASLHGEFRLCVGDRWVEIFGDAHNMVDGQATRISGLLRDITTKRALEAMKEDLAAFVVHELRSPVAAVKGSLRLLESGLVTEPAKRQDMLEIAIRGCDKLAGLVNDLLDVQKLERGKMQYQLEPLDIVLLVHRTVEENRGLATHYGVDFAFGQLEPAIVVGDSRRLQQVLVNLLSNAAKFTPEGGTVTVTTARGKESAIVTVLDQGSGVPESFRPSLFDKFTQAHNEDGRRSGTGIGLSLARLIIEDHDGTIDVENSDDGGAKFFFELPISDAPLVHQAPADEKAASSWPSSPAMLAENVYAGRRALVIDDQRANLALAQELLSNLGFEVELANGGREGIEAVKQDPGFDIVFMDVRMPDVDGYKTTQLIRDSLSGQRLPIVATTASVARENAARCLEAGMDDYLAKPIDHQELYRILERWVSSPRPRALHGKHEYPSGDIVVPGS